VVYNTQEYWVVGLGPLSGVLETQKNSVPENGSVPVVR
jgi:hypothetical protein